MRPPLWLALVLLVALAAGCAARPETASRPGLSAHLSSPDLAPDGLHAARVVVVVRNGRPGPATVNTFVLGSAVLSLDVTDAQGRPVPAGPPPVPPEGLVRFDRTLAPGDTLTFRYALHDLPADAPPGRYGVRMRGMASNKLVFTLR